MVMMVLMSTLMIIMRVKMTLAATQIWMVMVMMEKKRTMQMTIMMMMMMMMLVAMLDTPRSLHRNALASLKP